MEMFAEPERKSTVIDSESPTQDLGRETVISVTEVVAPQSAQVPGAQNGQPGRTPKCLLLSLYHADTS